MDKFRVLIIDDDKIELNVFMKCVDWEKIGMEVVGTASNGIAGLQMYRRLKPHIVVTDIEMPGLSGVELAKQIRNENTAIKIVYLSSHEKFEYAHSGYQLKISDYILKHKLKSDIIEDKLIKIKDIIKAESNQINDSAEEELKGYFISSTGESHYTSIQENTSYSLFLLYETSIFPSLYPYVPDTGSEKDHNASTIKQLLAEKFPNLYIFEIQNVFFLMYDQAITSQNLDTAVLRELKKKGKTLESDYYLIKLCRNRKLYEIKDLYYSIRDKLILRFLYDRNTVLDIDNFTVKNDNNVDLNFTFFLKVHSEHDREMTCKYLEDFFQPIIKCNDYSKYVENYNEMFLYIIKKIEQAAGSAPSMGMFNPSSIHTANEALSLLKELYIYYYSLCKEKEKSPQSDYITKSKRFIYENYNNPALDIEIIARHISLSPVRLRAIFKENTGQTVHQYITQIRLEKAKQLLREDRHMTLDQVALKVGYGSGRYLSRVFKKEFMVTPDRYRQKLEF